MILRGNKENRVNCFQKKLNLFEIVRSVSFPAGKSNRKLSRTRKFELLQHFYLTLNVAAISDCQMAIGNRRYGTGQCQVEML
ncbi:MAG: hypothetical protein FWG98_06520 [Candidatus Cloacimonetes bacterium]|nr:hypothetical protein [Candidatus Cloacimonadota bacterium]